MAKAKSFHELFFNGLFGRLIRKSVTAKGEREFLLQKDTDLLWNPKNSYLLLPLKKSNDICPGSLQIHWSAISSCYSAIEFVRRKFSLVAEESDDTSSLAMEPESTNMFHFANTVADVSNIKDTVALAVHTGKIYCIIDVVDSSSAESPFDGNNEKSGSRTTFSQYFKERCIVSFITLFIIFSL